MSCVPVQNHHLFQVCRWAMLANWSKSRWRIRWSWRFYVVIGRTRIYPVVLLISTVLRNAKASSDVTWMKSQNFHIVYVINCHYTSEVNGVAYRRLESQLRPFCQISRLLVVFLHTKLSFWEGKAFGTNLGLWNSQIGLSVAKIYSCKCGVKYV